MHGVNNRAIVFARKPAPVQVGYLASLGGTGLDTIDYRLTDRHLDPDEGNDKFYLEKSMRLPGTYWCYQPSPEAGPVNGLPALTNGRITLGCLNEFTKVSTDTLQTWATLLRALPEARLLLHARAPCQRRRVMRFLGDQGIAPDRLDFVGRLPTRDYFDLYHRIDIALDPYPYVGGTTTCDALWMGVPVVTLAGRTAVGRGGVSILTNVDLPELIAQTPEQYVRIALELAGNLPRLAAMRSTLRQQIKESPLMDAGRFVRDVEAAYRTMWRTWCETT
jgi:predicted O-linked N-acetylglucosamine transferase (SPINDLY family)